MGTRNLIAVQKDGRYGIAQYGQWDGYPSGQGVSVLAFAKAMDREEFGKKVSQTKFLTEEELIMTWIEAGAERGQEYVSIDIADKRSKLYPQLSRDCGAKILEIVEGAPDGVALKDSSNFAGESLFCEYAYVIDLDLGTFEVFRGFNKDTLDESERFAKTPTDHAEYKQIKFWKSWPLDELPEEDEFLSELSENGESEED